MKKKTKKEEENEIDQQKKRYVNFAVCVCFDSSVLKSCIIFGQANLCFKFFRYRDMPHGINIFANRSVRLSLSPSLFLFHAQMACKRVTHFKRKENKDHTDSAKRKIP